jgi:preprotein translocase subunit SecG
MFTALLVLQVFLGISIIALVLLQQGKGADMGAAFGAGASGTVFGARGSGSFFTRATAVLAALFFINSVLLSSPLVLGDRHPTQSVTDAIVSQPEAPAVPAEPKEAPEDNVDLPPADLPEADSGAGEETTDSAPAAPAAGDKAATSSGDKKAAAGAADKKPADKKPE